MLDLILKIRRANGWAEYRTRVPEDAYLLDALEEAGRQDPTLLFRHACHHASCGTCGLRVNGRERLACVTPAAELARSGKPVRLEPLRNFPVLGDLVVDLGELYRSVDPVDLPLLRQAEPLAGQAQAGDPGEAWTRFENCIECGLCVSACPVAVTDAAYSGPAALAAAWRVVSEPRGRLVQGVPALVDQAHGLWRCHSVFECSEVCPANVDPGGSIMHLRRWVLASKLSRKEP